jgi:hypothetical protein
MIEKFIGQVLYFVMKQDLARNQDYNDPEEERFEK